MKQQKPKSRTVDVEHARTIEKQRILFDTNIWLFVNGPTLSAPEEKVNSYSLAYSDLLRNENEILINDYIIGEFCNRSAKLEYDAYRADCESRGEAVTSFKRLRKTTAFSDKMKRIGESCHEMARDSTYAHGPTHCCIEDVIGRFIEGKLDFTDLVIVDFCKGEGALLMTDDGDFLNCGLDLITANPYLLRRSSNAR